MRRSVFGSRRERKKARRSRAFLNGVEITSDCQWADNRAGRALVMLRNAKGRHYFDRSIGAVAKAIVQGSVRIERMESR